MPSESSVGWTKFFSLSIAICLSITFFIYWLKVFEWQRAWFPIVSRYLVDDLNGMFIFPFTHKIFRTFIQTESKKPDCPENKHQRTHREKKVSPSSVRSSGAARCRYIARVFTNERPCNLWNSWDWGFLNLKRLRTRLPRSWPKAHQIERTVRRYWCDAGRNSTRKIYQRVWDCIWDGSPRNTAESTGTFPPTPIDHTDAKRIRVVGESEAPATVEKRPIMRKVMLNEILIVQSDPD